MRRDRNFLWRLLAQLKSVRSGELGVSDFRGRSFAVVDRPALLIVAAVLTAFSGCGTRVPATTPTVPGNPPEQNGPSLQVEAKTKPADQTQQTAVVSQKDGSPVAGTSANEPGKAQNPKLVAADTKQVSKSAATNAAVAAPSKPKRIAPPATPSPEQIAKWAIPDFPPLQLLACYDGPSSTFVQSMAISPDGKRVVLGGARLTIWNLGETEPLVDLIAKYNGDTIERPIRSIAISPNGELLAAGDQKGMLRIWSLSDQHETVAIRAHEGHMTRLTFSPNSEILATTSHSGEVRLWQTSDGKKIRSMKVSTQEIIRLEFLTDTLLAVAGKETSLWNVETGMKETVLTTGNVIGPAMGLSRERQRLAYNDSDSQLKFWDVEKSSRADLTLRGAGAHLIDFSPDGKWIAIESGDTHIRIWDAETGRLVQVIDGNGGRTVSLRWLPQSTSLVVASESGRVRIWGTPDAAAAIGIPPIELPTLGTISATAKRSLSSGHWPLIIDVRSFPRLPRAVPQWEHSGTATYNVEASQAEAELFYRYFLGKSGWTEVLETTSFLPGLNFRKDDCALNVSLTPTGGAGADSGGTLQVNLQFSGNYDVQWLPKISPINSPGSWSSPSSVSYRAKGELTDIEVALLKQFHEAGWTSTTRLNSSHNERPDARSFTMLQGGSVLTVSIGYPADSTTELFVQVSVNVSNKSLPIPPDSGWIEFDSSTDLLLVANTGMDLKQTTDFYDTAMASEGWLSREAGRHFKEDKGYLPYIRGQQDVLIRLVARPEGGTRIIVGDAERSSWQLQKPPKIEAETETFGIEAADFALPKGATDVAFDVDEKQIQFKIAEITAPKLIDVFVEQLQSLDWKRERAGLISDEYCFVTFLKEKTEIQVRVRSDATGTSGVISGKGILWSKPLPTPPVRVSYETWMRRSRKEATLKLLDEFADEMHKIPEAVNKK